MAPVSLELIKRHLSYAFECDSKVQTLQHEIAQLENKKDRLQQSVNDATSYGKEIYWNVTSWLSDADKAINEAKKVVQWREETKKCFAGLCPDLKVRYQISKQVEKKALTIGKLCNEEFNSISFRSLVETCTYSSKLLPSRVLLLNQIMDALKDPSLDMIGVYGVGGVGKTTLAKVVCARAREEELFDDVIMISVSGFPNLRRIQAEIAAFLGLKVDAEAKLLIILDDVWQKLDLQALGIPFGDECKLLVSSRSKEVLSSEMGSQKDFLVDVLSGEESWSLFRTIATPELKDARLNAIIFEKIKRCAGLPLLIVLISLQLKKKELHVQLNNLNQLPVFRNEDSGERVHRVVESIFENLPEKELKSLFLLCASFSQSDIQIQHLLIYCMGLCLFEVVMTFEEARDRLSYLINKLQEEGLLHVKLHDMLLHVKLHDMVRDSAITIASQHNHKDIIPDWSNKDCTRVWLKDLPTSLQCPKAELFVLSSEDLCLEIPDLFFEGIPKLKVVDFTGIHFATRLPSSLVCLKDLDTLCLHRCRLDNTSVIGELTALKFLSFADSDIVELPREIGALTQLKLLDLTNCSKLQVIPTNVISKLLSLEELCMRNSYVRWDEEGNVSLAELEKLSCLSSLEIQIVNPNTKLKFSSFYNKLGRYKIIIGEEQGIRWEKYAMSSSRMLRLVKPEESFRLEDADKLFLREIEDLCIYEVSGMDDLIGDGFPRLRHLCIKNDYGIQHLINLSASNPFPVLESLCLDNLSNLKMICDGTLEKRCFGNLRILKISDCDKLMSLFLFSSLGCLEKLEEMEVESCENMETILSEGSKDIQLGSLRSLKLKNLPNLKGFCEKKGLLFQDKRLYNLASLEVKNCKSLKYVFATSIVGSFLGLKWLEINDCELVEEIIWHEESRVEQGINKIELRSLKYVFLKKLKNLKRFGSGFPIEFTSLTDFSIHKCPAMEHFVPEIAEKNASSKGNECHFGENVILYNLDGKRFPRMMHLHIQNGHGIPHTITLNNLNSLESLYFGEVRSLNASNCNRLKNLCLFSSAKCSTQLLDLEVQSCRNIEAIVGGESQAESLELTQLRSLKLENLPHLTSFCKQKQGSGPAQLLFNKMVSFPNLTSLVVEKCNSLKFVFTTSIVKCLVQLKELEISNCELVEAIIHSNKTEENEEQIINPIVFRKLEALSLNGLPNMKMFACGYEVEFPVLRELSLECSTMVNFVSKSSDGTNNYNADEHLFNEQVTFSNLESLIVRNMDTFRYLWHEKIILDDSFLKQIIEYCKLLKGIGPDPGNCV